jgi:serine/threonine-protein kinase
LLAALIVFSALAYFIVDKFRISKHSLTTLAPAITAFTPPPHSLAVLPFVNISGDKQQEYFSDGLTEELLNSLSRINELQVAARTSSFYFKGKDVDLPTIAHRLNVASVLEGSVRRSGNKVRVTAQLTNAVTGFHLWSQTYDRDLSDVLQLQTEIANAVANALKVTLLDDVAAKIELGGTRKPAAFDAYLRGSKALYSGQGVSSNQSAIAAYTEAIRLDASYALAFAGRSQALSGYAWEFATGMAIRKFWDKSQADARQALNLAPELAEGYLALALNFQRGSHDFARANEAFERAMALAPGNAMILGEGGRFAAQIGRFDAGVAATRRAVTLDPLSAQSRALLGEALYWARRYGEAVAAYGEVVSLEPGYEAAYGFRGLAYYGLGDLQSARSSCETKRDYWLSQRCLAVTYDKIGRHADAEAQLKKLQATYGDAAAYSYSTIYAQWGDRAKALEWLATAMREPCGCLVYVRTDPLLDPLRTEPRFQAIERALHFPD